MAFKPFLYLSVVVLALFHVVQATELHVFLSQETGLVPSVGLAINFTIRNPSDKAVTILAWDTPFDSDMYRPIFSILDSNGDFVEYTGKMGRRAWPPAAESYLVIEAYGSRSVEVDLTENYAFTAPGAFLVRFRHPRHDPTLTFVSSTASVRLNALPDLLNYQGQSHLKATRNTNCNANQNSQVSAAVRGAVTESAAAYNCMNKRTCDALSTKWFGTYSATNFNYDKATFQKINSRLSNYAFNAYCNPAGCGNDVYAYVYPNDPSYTVYLCGAFWSQPNERVNTVVHEMSHFDTLGGTDDYAYGQPACLQLAKTNPNRASHNADNVCYFSQDAALLVFAEDARK